MAVEYRAVTADEIPDLMEADRLGFGSPPRKAGASDTWARGELDRTRCAFEAGRVVGTSRTYSFELTVPGGAYVPAAAVSWVSVLPTHRRRGILTGMLRALHHDARERGEPVAILTASEGVIYGRFGYGIATWRMGCTVERARSTFARPVDDAGRVRLVDNAEASKHYPQVYERARSARAGMVSRPDFWWPEVYWGYGEGKAMFEVVHETADGNVDGYASYEIEGQWHGGVPSKQVIVFDLQADTGATRAALWRYVLDVDLIQKISAINLPVDEPLRFLLADPRALRVDYVNDGCWVLALDPAALLAARCYAIEGRLVLEVFGPGDERVHVTLDGGPDGAQCAASKASPDLVMSRSTLGAISLGGNACTTLATAGLIEERTTGALARADAMFATNPAPATTSFF